MAAGDSLDERSRARQFWVRVLLAIGMLWGFLPFVMAPFITKGANDTSFDIFASVLNSLTVLPACALAFRHRRIACVWLSANAVILGTALGTFIARTGKFERAMVLEVAGPILIALCLDFLEALHWPAAMNAAKAKARRG